MTRALNLLREMRAELSSIIWAESPRMIVLTLSLVTAATGIWFLRPYDTFGVLDAYDWMGRQAPEETWGRAMIAIGTFKFVVLLLSRRIFASRRLSVRLLAPALNFAIGLFWVVLLSGVLESDPNTMLTIYYSSISLGCFWTAFRRLHEALNVPRGTFAAQRRRTAPGRL